MLAYADEEAVKFTESTGFAHYYSRSRGKIWKKGEESGHFQEISAILVDCDADALPYLVNPKEAASHTGYRSCFHRMINGDIVGEKVFDPEKIYSHEKLSRIYN